LRQRPQNNKQMPIYQPNKLEVAQEHKPRFKRSKLTILQSNWLSTSGFNELNYKQIIQGNPRLNVGHSNHWPDFTYVMAKFQKTRVHSPGTGGSRQKKKLQDHDRSYSNFYPSIPSIHLCLLDWDYTIKILTILYREC